MRLREREGVCSTITSARSVREPWRQNGNSTGASRCESEKQREHKKETVNMGRRTKTDQKMRIREQLVGTGETVWAPYWMERRGRERWLKAQDERCA